MDDVLLRPTLTLYGHTSEVTCCVFSPDGTALATSSDDRTLRLWRTGDGCCLASLLGHADTVWCCAFSPDGATLASASADGTARLWSTDTATCRAVYSCAYSPDGKALATTSLDRSARLWDTAAGTSEILGRRSFIELTCCFSPDGQVVAVGADSKAVRLWRVADHQLLAMLVGHSKSVGCVVFSPDGAALATASDDSTVMLWRADTGDCTATLSGHTGAVNCCVYSPDGATIASGADDNTVRLWRVSDSTCTAVLRGHTNWVWSCAFSPDGKAIASASRDGTAKLWVISGPKPSCGPMSRAAAGRARLEACNAATEELAKQVQSAAVACEQADEAAATAGSEAAKHEAELEALRQQVAEKEAAVREIRSVLESAERAQVAAREAASLVMARAEEARHELEKAVAEMKQSRAREAELWAKIAGRSVAALTCEDVADVLCELGMQRHVEWFRANDISGEVLDSVDLKSLQLSPPECKTLFQALETLKACGLLRVTHAALIARSEGLEQQKRDALLAVTWDMEGVAKWMQSQGLPEDVRALFEEWHVCGEELVFMRVKELKGLGITSLGKRVAVFKKITELRTAHLEALAQCIKTAGAEQAAGPAVPQEYVCPITLRVMENPVVAPDGHIYEASAIGQWMHGHSTSPVTGQHMESAPYKPCWTLRAAIREFLNNANSN
eukprot:m51a1_g6153 putative wd40 repeat-containing protein (676) ;mRNA; f:307854-310445